MKVLSRKAEQKVNNKLQKMKVNYLFSGKETFYVLCKSLEKPSIITVKAYRYISILFLRSFKYVS